MPKQPQDHQTKQTPAERAEAEATAGPEPIVVKWQGKTWHVRPVNKWGKSWRRHLDVEDWDRWAECVLPGPEYAAWEDLPASVTGEDVLEFIGMFNGASGQDVGESAAS